MYMCIIPLTNKISGKQKHTPHAIIHLTVLMCIFCYTLKISWKAWDFYIYVGLFLVLNFGVYTIQFWTGFTVIYTYIKYAYVKYKCNII